MASSCFLTLLEKLRAKEWERVEDDGGGGRRAEGERRGEGFAFCEAFLLILARVSTLLISGGKAVCRSYRIIHLVEGRNASDLDSKTDNSKVISLKLNKEYRKTLDGVCEQRTPGLSAYAKDPEAAAKSLTELLEKAEAVVPEELRYITPVKVGATTGLRQLEGDASDRILQAVRDYLKNESSLQYCWSG